MEIEDLSLRVSFCSVRLVQFISQRVQKRQTQEVVVSAHEFTEQYCNVPDG